MISDEKVIKYDAEMNFMVYSGKVTPMHLYRSSLLF